MNASEARALAHDDVSYHSKGRVIDAIRGAIRDDGQCTSIPNEFNLTDETTQALIDDGYSVTKNTISWKEAKSDKEQANS